MRGFSKTEAVGLFIAGAAVGAAAALLLTPKTGAQARKEIRRFSKRAVGQLDDLQSDIRDQITDGYEQVKSGYQQVKRMITTA
jgi:gas vesicle protein